MEPCGAPSQRAAQGPGAPQDQRRRASLGPEAPRAARGLLFLFLPFLLTQGRLPSCFPNERMREGLFSAGRCKTNKYYFREPAQGNYLWMYCQPWGFPRWHGGQGAMIFMITCV